MKLVSYVEPYMKTERIGILMRNKTRSYIVDANIAYRSYLYHSEGLDYPERIADGIIPNDMVALLRNGNKSIDELKKVEKYVGEKGLENIIGPKGERIVFDYNDVKVLAPVPRPGKIIHTAGNFREHAKEGKEAGWEFPIPKWISFLKSTSAIIGDGDNIVYPEFTKELDYEIELAIIIGKKCKYANKKEAWNSIAGFTVFNDITARDIQRQEMKSGLLNFGKNMDTFAPFGPCLVTRDDVGDVHNLDIECRVNGEVRQKSNTSHLSVTIPEIVSHYSWVTLYPGDIITTGTVSGVAAFRKNPEKYYLKPGDTLESEIENIGVLRNRVVKEK
jgi:2-keto-4-pentenoate hydratase/2-oxohepta-3-ene-1,7-dioic acid hydratase in catechol pathway